MIVLDLSENGGTNINFIPSSDIEEISGFSINKANRLPLCVLGNGSCYWLKENDTYANFEHTVPYVDWYGNIKWTDITNAGIEARPVLKIKDLDLLYTLYRDYIDKLEVRCLNLDWYYIGDNSILSKYSIGHCKYNLSGDKPDANKFKGSNLKKYLNNWLRKKIKSEYNFLAKSDKHWVLANDKDKIIFYIKDWVELGYEGPITILNTKTGLTKELSV